MKKKSIKTPYKPTKEEKDKAFKNQMILLEDIVTVKLAPSTIHGIGVFTVKDIKKGDKLYTDVIPHQFDLPYEMFKTLPEYIKEMILGHFPLITSGSHFLYPTSKLSAYLNHSETPNYDAKEDKALTDIPKGTEVTENYKLIKNWKKVFTFIK